MFILFLRERKRQSMSERGAEREGDTEFEAGSELSAQGLTWGLKPWDHDLRRSWTLNCLSHLGASNMSIFFAAAVRTLLHAVPLPEFIFPLTLVTPTYAIDTNLNVVSYPLRSLIEAPEQINYTCRTLYIFFRILSALTVTDLIFVFSTILEAFHRYYSVFALPPCI